MLCEAELGYNSIVLDFAGSVAAPSRPLLFPAAAVVVMDIDPVLEAP